jgi:septal ring factor EnvC (AmiA/AmiB activator)
MKTITIKITLLAAASLMTLPCLKAQPTNQSQREELASARQQAIAQNPSLEQNIKAAQQALSEARSALTNAMAQIDPNVVQIWADIRAAEQKIQSNPQMQADEKAIRQLRRQLMNQDDPGYYSENTNHPSNTNQPSQNESTGN